ncbi:unnamed protein product, partial [marine sediment metagenome]
SVFMYFLFDLDNCLVEIPNIGNYFDQLLVETLKEFDVKRIPEFNERKQIWFVGKQYINLLKSWGIKTHQKFWKVLDLKDFKQRKKLIHDGRIMLFEDVLQVLKELYRLNKRMGIISNTPDNIIKYQLDYFKIKKYFDIVVGLGEDQTICKPEPTGINIVLNYFSENGQIKREKNFKRIQSEAIMIGDSIVDIISANRAKVKSCLILRKQHHYTEEIKSWEYQPNFIINQLDEILKL